MMEGLDTSFFFALRKGEENPRALWKAILNEDREAVVSSVTIFELLRHGLKGSIDRTFSERVAGHAGVAFEQGRVDSPNVLHRSARIAHGMGLSMADAMIAASLEEMGCERLHTSDHDFEDYDGPMQIIFF